MNNYIYRRMPEGVYAGGSFAVVGCGGVGTWVAAMLAMSGAKELELYDSDTLSVDNLSRLPYPEAAIGEPKARLLRDWLHALRPECDIRVFPHWQPFMGAPQASVVLSCVDSYKIRRALCITCRVEHLSYIDVGADGFDANVDSQPAEFDISQGNDYQRGIYAPTAMLAASMACHVALTCRRAKYARIGFVPNEERFYLQEGDNVQKPKEG